MLLHWVFFCLKRNIIEISNKIVYNKKADENMLEKLYMFSQARFHSVPAIVSKTYIAFLSCFPLLFYYNLYSNIFQYENIVQICFN